MSYKKEVICLPDVCKFICVYFIFTSMEKNDFSKKENYLPSTAGRH
jgi:uncharacterized protein YutD